MRAAFHSVMEKPKKEYSSHTLRWDSRTVLRGQKKSLRLDNDQNMNLNRAETFQKQGAENTLRWDKGILKRHTLMLDVQPKCVTSVLHSGKTRS